MTKHWQWPKTIDFSLYFIPLLLGVIGLVTLYAGSFSAGGRQFFINQSIFLVSGIFLMLFLTFLDYRLLKGLGWLFYLLSLLFLTLVFFFGKDVFGARRWIDFGFFNFQPSELLKLSVVIFISSLLNKKIGQINLQLLLWLVVLLVLPIFFVIKQPDLGTAITILIIFGAIFLASRPNRWLLFFLLTVLTIITPTSWFFLRDYQKTRLLTFFNSGGDSLGAGYNVWQSIIAIGSGGLTGRGLGQGTQSQLQFLPVAQTDFIFASWAEATGLIGSVVLILLFLVIIWRIINVAAVSKDDFGRLLAIGIASLLLFPMIVNIGMNMGLMPVTGIPLPFISHGGSSLLVAFSAIGICQSIYLRHKKISF